MLIFAAICLVSTSFHIIFLASNTQTKKKKKKERITKYNNRLIQNKYNLNR